MENKQKTTEQSKMWSLSIEAYNNETNEFDLTIEQAINKIKHETHYYFGINHDKDITELGEVRKSHLHIVLKLKTKITKNGLLKKLATLLEIDITRISAQITRNQDLMIRYLMHIDNKEKEPYPPFEVITNRKDILNNAIKGESEREDLTAESLILTIEKFGGNRLKIMGEIGLKNYTRFRGTIADIIEELEIGNMKTKAIETASRNIQNANEIAKKIMQHANTQVNKQITERITEIETKVVNTKAMELLNKKKNRL